MFIGATEPHGWSHRWHHDGPMAAWQATHQHAMTGTAIAYTQRQDALPTHVGQGVLAAMSLVSGRGGSRRCVELEPLGLVLHHPRVASLDQPLHSVVDR